MPSSYLDRYGRGRTVCHRWPPRFKLLLTLAVVVTGVSIPPEYWHAQTALMALTFIGHSLAQIPLAYIGRRLALFLPAVVVLSMSFPLASGFAAGWEIMAAILLRSTLAFLAALWLINVMPFDELLLALRRCRVPELLVAMLAFMYRYLFVVWDELDRMRRARRARTFGRQSLLSRWTTSVQLVGMLLIRGMTRAERVHAAMCARGWDGRVRRLDDS